MGSAGVATPGMAYCHECAEPFLVRGIKQRFCSARCRMAYYDRLHPRIAAPAAPGVSPRSVPIKARIVSAMADRMWRTTAALAYELRESEGTVSRKLRQLRAEGFVIESRPTASSSRAPHEFRLMLVGAVPEVRA